MKRGLIGLWSLVLLIAALTGCDAALDETAVVPVSSDGETVRAKGIALAETEIRACNGVIYAVDMVLLHPAVERLVLTEETGGADNVDVSPEMEAAEQAQADKVTICHATHSETNPYNEITIARSGLNGHRHHEGDIIPAPEGGCGADASPTEEAEMTGEAEVEATQEVEVVTACEEGTTIAALLRADERFSVFVELLEREGLLQTLEEAGPYTVFAPTNAAFDALPPDVLAAWQTDDAQLTTVLLYHIVQGLFMAVDLQQISTISSLNNASISVVVVDGIVYLERRMSLGGDQPEQGGEDEGESEPQGGGGKVTICHRTNSEKNPYNMITVDENALSAHAGHGDIIPAPAGGCPSK